MNVTASSLVLLFLFSADCFAQKISHDELVEILGIKSWRVPMPKDKSMEWSIEIVDYAPRKFTKMRLARLSFQQKALVVLRETNKDIFQFTLKRRAGTGQGDLEIDVCSEKEKEENLCDNSYSLEWYDVAKPFDDGSKFVIADISHMLEPHKPRKQIILVPVRFRLEDIVKGRQTPR
jgi:hypothetical protein